MKIKVGFGYDVHQLKIGETLNIGGIIVPHTKGTLGHSDADVLTHAICDALLGAINMRDIGFNFPDTDKKYKNIDSKILLKKINDLLVEKGFCISNIDSTICLQQPKISDYIPKMQQILSDVLNISIDDISIKATTTENLGFIGKKEGISAYAVVLIIKN